MPYFYNPTKLEAAIPPICFLVAVPSALLSIIISMVVTDRIPSGVLPSMSWAGDVYPESVFFNLAMIFTAVQMLFVYLLYDRAFGPCWRFVLLVLVVTCIIGLLLLATVSVGNNNPVHSIAAGVAFFSLYTYVALRAYLLWMQCKRQGSTGMMKRFKASLIMLLGLFVMSIPTTVCCFVFFTLYMVPAKGDPYSVYYLFFVIFEIASVLIVDTMHIVTWAAYNAGHTNALK
jgi:hypothetical protein